MSIEGEEMIDSRALSIMRSRDREREGTRASVEGDYGRVETN